MSRARRQLIAAVAVLALASTMALAACGQEDVPTESEVSSAARELARDTAALTQDVAESGRAIAADPRADERVAAELDQQEQRARALAERVEELPDEQGARDALREANERTADAARELREFARSNDEAALRRGRDALARAEDQLARSADELERSLPEAARDAIDDLRQSVPEIPGG